MPIILTFPGFYLDSLGMLTHSNLGVTQNRDSCLEKYKDLRRMWESLTILLH